MELWSSRNYLKFSFLSVFLSALFIYINGTYYGWIDDALMANLLRGICFPKPIYSSQQFTVFANVLIQFYKWFPGIAWYGWFIYAALFFAFLLLSNVFFTLVEQHLVDSKVKMFLSALVFSLLMQEFVQRNNYTVLGCLLTGAGLLFLLVKNATRLNILLSFFAILSGLMIRFQVSAIVLFFAVPSSVIICTTILKNAKKRRQIFIVSISSVALVFLAQYLFYNPDEIRLNELSFFEQLIQDAYIFPEKVTETEAIKLEAIRSWNQFDERIITETFLKSLYKGFHFNFSDIKHLLVLKMKMLYEYGTRYPKEKDCFNWWNKNNLLLLSAIFLSIVASIYGKGKRVIVTVGAQIVFCLGIILIVAISAKMEDRLLYPLLLLLNLFVLGSIALSNQGKKVPLFLLLLPFFAFGIYRCKDCANARVILDKDIKNKRELINEINTYSDKIFFFDMYTYYLLNLGPFENVELSSNNHYSAAFHYVARHFHSTRNYFPAMCGTERIDEIMTCLYDKKDKIIFAYWVYNIDFLHRWNKIIYNKNITLEPMASKSHLTQTSNAYIWSNMDHNYYTFK